MAEERQGTESTFRGTQVRDDGGGPVLVAHRLSVVVVDGPDRGRDAAVEGTHFGIGTADGNDLVLTDRTVSRHHCEIAVRDDRYVVRDLGSTNNTLLDGTPVVEAFVSPGARVRVGDTELLFEPKKKWERVQADKEANRFGEMVGESPAMRDVFAMLERVSRTDLSCILVGETGTGKELAARAVHSNGHRSEGPFVVVDCGAVSENLIESELFGHEKGAFTGADRQRAGAFEAASRGTIFLDEIGELPLHLQPKLLRVLERREVKRLGASKPMDVDVRIVSATHRDLPAMVREGTFREDLYYRLAEVVVKLPPLRDRPTDVGIIAQRIVAEEGASGGRVRSIAPEAVEDLRGRGWPGNVRELRNVLRRAIAMADGATLVRDDLQLGFQPAVSSSPATDSDGPTPEVAESLPIKEARERWVSPMEREYLVRLMQRCGGDLDQAAHEAGIHRKSLERLLRQHGLRSSDLRH